jgi:hypothetical protein
MRISVSILATLRSEHGLSRTGLSSALPSEVSQLYVTLTYLSPVADCLRNLTYGPNE